MKLPFFLPVYFLLNRNLLCDVQMHVNLENIASDVVTILIYNLKIHKIKQYFISKSAVPNINRTEAIAGPSISIFIF